LETKYKEESKKEVVVDKSVLNKIYPPVQY
jgi:hypothetical protein